MVAQLDAQMVASHPVHLGMASEVRGDKDGILALLSAIILI